MNNLKTPTFEPMIPAMTCPCCGSRATIKHFVSKQFLRKTIVYHYVQCDTCGLHTRLADTKATAVFLWDRRV